MKIGRLSIWKRTDNTLEEIRNTFSIFYHS